MRSEEFRFALLDGYARVSPFTGGEAPLPIRAAARDVLFPLPLVALIIANTMFFSPY